MRQRFCGTLATAALLAACSGPSSKTGLDRASGSDASTITWTDGKPSVVVRCG
jgi:hypothetical protein